MSTKALFWAMEQDIPPGPKLVLIMIADWYNKQHNYAWPKHSELAERTGYGVSTVKRHIEWLIKYGLVKKEKQFWQGSQRANRYYLNLSVMAFQVAQNGLAGGSNCSTPVAQNELPSNTLTNTPKDTLKDAGASEDDDLKFKKGGTIAENLAQVDSEMWGMDKDEALMKIRKGISNGKIKPSYLEKLWKFARLMANDIDYGKHVPLTGKEKGQLMHAWDKLGEDMLNIVWEVMGDWAGFTRVCERDGTAFNSPTKPNVIYFTQNLSIAVDFTAVNVGDDDGWDDI